MSANVYWKKADESHLSLGVDAPSSFIATMERAFYSHPWRLCASDVPKLEGMAAMFSDHHDDNPYHEMIELIAKFGAIEVWPQW